MAEMQVELVAVERKVWSGTAEFVFARTAVGEVGILPRHEPLIAQLVDAGMVRIDPPDGESVRFAVHGGFLSVTPERVAILAEQAESSDEIDVSAARDALQQAERDGGDEKAVARARARLEAAGEDPDS